MHIFLADIRWECMTHVWLYHSLVHWFLAPSAPLKVKSGGFTVRNNCSKWMQLPNQLIQAETSSRVREKEVYFTLFPFFTKPPFTYLLSVWKAAKRTTENGQWVHRGRSLLHSLSLFSFLTSLFSLLLLFLSSSSSLSPSPFPSPLLVFSLRV